MRIFSPRKAPRFERLIEGFIEASQKLGKFDNKRHDDQLQTFMISGVSVVSSVVAHVIDGDHVGDMTSLR
jgi:hypothetical protein